MPVQIAQGCGGISALEDFQNKLVRHLVAWFKYRLSSCGAGRETNWGLQPRLLW